MAESCSSSTNARVTIFALAFQVLIFCCYLNSRLTIWSPTRLTVNTTQVMLPLLRNTFNTSSPSVSTNTTNRTETRPSSKPFAVTNRERVNWMREYCASNKQKVVKRYPNYERLRNGLPGYVWMASPHHRLFYCATPKCASTTWKTYILEDAQIKWKGDNHQAAAGKIGVRQMFTERKTEFMPFLEKYRPANRLVIVRNPWARLVSAYEDKIVHTKWSLKTLCVAGNKYPTNRSTIISFATLIDCLTNSNRDVIWNAHINPFTSLCGFCYMDYNIIVKLEEMAEAEPFIKQKLNFSDTELHYKPKRKGKYSNTYAGYYKALTDNHIRQLQEIYSDDIELFGYPRTPFE